MNNDSNLKRKKIECYKKPGLSTYDFLMASGSRRVEKLFPYNKKEIKEYKNYEVVLDKKNNEYIVGYYDRFCDWHIDTIHDNKPDAIDRKNKLNSKEIKNNAGNNSNTTK